MICSFEQELKDQAKSMATLLFSGDTIPQGFDSRLIRICHHDRLRLLSKHLNTVSPTMSDVDVKNLYKDYAFLLDHLYRYFHKKRFGHWPDSDSLAFLKEKLKGQQAYQALRDKARSDKVPFEGAFYYLLQKVFGYSHEELFQALFQYQIDTGRIMALVVAQVVGVVDQDPGVLVQISSPAYSSLLMFQKEKDPPMEMCEDFKLVEVHFPETPESRH